MSSIQVIRGRQIIVFCIGLIFAFASVGASGYIAYKGLSMFPEAEKNDGVCEKHLIKNGFVVSRINNGMKAIATEPQLIEKSVLQAGLAVPFCSDFELTQFCAGGLCDEGAVSFTLLNR